MRIIVPKTTAVFIELKAFWRACSKYQSRTPQVLTFRQLLEQVQSHSFEVYVSHESRLISPTFSGCFKRILPAQVPLSSLRSHACITSLSVHFCSLDKHLLACRNTNYTESAQTQYNRSMLIYYVCNHDGIFGTRPPLCVTSPSQ